MNTEKHSRLTKAFANCIVFLLLAILTQLIVRVIFMSIFTNIDTFIDNSDYIALFILNALRFDLQIASYAALPIFLIALINIFYKIDAQKFTQWYTCIILTLIAIIGFADIQFYSNFNQHFNIVTFDFFDEEPSVLIKGIVNDAPIFKILIGAVGVFFLIWFVNKAINNWLSRHIVPKTLIIAIVATVIILPIGLRGSLGTFTLRAEDIYVSPSTKMNDCVPNAIFMIKKAWSEKKKQFKISSESDILKAEGFNTIAEACAMVGHETDNIDSVLFIKTPSIVPFENYNVVVILTESWSNRLIEYEKKYGFDLLSSMRQHISEDIIFRNFLSTTNGTIDALESFTINSVHPHMFTSSYRNIEYNSATAKAFRDKGYQTEFISGIEISWRNLIEVLPHQGFDRVIGKFEIQEEMPDAEQNRTWGVYDHSMLKYTLNELNKPSSKPRFILCLTSTSHTPFEFPDDYELPQIDLSNVPKGTFAVDDDIAIEYLKGYQYESKALGEFMSQLKKSGVGDSTIVAITGDHNIRLILPYEGVEKWWQYSVPLYMYIPDKDVVKVDTARCGSHNDIMPTIANLVLSNATYFNSGQNLFADTIAKGTVGINTNDTIYSSEADVEKLQKQLSAMQAIKKIYFERQFKQERR